MRGLYLTADLMFSSRVLAAASTLGFKLDVCMSVARFHSELAAGDVRLVIFDLAMPGVAIAEAVAQARSAAPQARLVAYGPHVQVDMMRQALDAGCHDVLSRGEFQAAYPGLLSGAANAAFGDPQAGK